MMMSGINAFIHRFQADLQANERAINGYFQHRYGAPAKRT